jgi:type II secretory pathway pseudopilin PulG
MNMMNPRLRNRQAGMTLIETMIAALVLTIGVAAVAAVYTEGILFLGSSQDDFIAKQKAQEAIESVFTARDTGTLLWKDIRNVQGASGADGGVFLDGPFPLNDPGNDGLVNTIDDGPLQSMRLPGPDNILGTADDVIVPLTKWRREIQIRDYPAMLNLRTLTVIVTYTSGRLKRTYRLSTLISQYS